MFRAACDGAFSVRLELPKPTGARPRSVEFPCASQVRPELPDALLFEGAFEGAREEFVIDEGGRLCESCAWRLFVGALPAVPREKVAEFDVPTRALAGRPTVKCALLNVFTWLFAAPAAGAVRAITERF